MPTESRVERPTQEWLRGFPSFMQPERFLILEILLCARAWGCVCPELCA